MHSVSDFISGCDKISNLKVCPCSLQMGPSLSAALSSEWKSSIKLSFRTDFASETQDFQIFSAVDLLNKNLRKGVPDHERLILFSQMWVLLTYPALLWVWRRSTVTSAAWTEPVKNAKTDGVFFVCKAEPMIEWLAYVACLKLLKCHQSESFKLKSSFWPVNQVKTGSWAQVETSEIEPRCRPVGTSQ